MLLALLLTKLLNSINEMESQDVITNHVELTMADKDSDQVIESGEQPLTELASLALELTHVHVPVQSDFNKKFLWSNVDDINDNVDTIKDENTLKSKDIMLKSDIVEITSDNDVLDLCISAQTKDSLVGHFEEDMTTELSEECTQLKNETNDLNFNKKEDKCNEAVILSKTYEESINTKEVSEIIQDESLSEQGISKPILDESFSKQGISEHIQNDLDKLKIEVESHTKKPGLDDDSNDLKFGFVTDNLKSLAETEVMSTVIDNKRDTHFSDAIGITNYECTKGEGMTKYKDITGEGITKYEDFTGEGITKYEDITRGGSFSRRFRSSIRLGSRLFCSLRKVRFQEW